MGQSFDITRFAKLLRHDVRSSPKEYAFSGLWMAIGFAPLMVLTQQYIAHDHVGTLYRIIMMVGEIAVYALFVPHSVYPNVGKKKRGIYFALLPATKAEKHLSMATVSMVLSPIVLLAIGLISDVLLTAVHLPGYDKYFWQAEAWHSISLQMIVSVVVSFIGAVFAAIYSNAVRHKGLRYIVYFAASLGLIGGMIGVPALIYVKHGSSIYWVVIAIETAMALLFAWLSRRKMDKMEY